MTHDSSVTYASGLAALGICESLILALTDLQILNEEVVRDLLTDVETAHKEEATTSNTPEAHHAVVAILRRILDGKNGVRHHVIA